MVRKNKNADVRIFRGLKSATIEASRINWYLFYINAGGALFLFNLSFFLVHCVFHFSFMIKASIVNVTINHFILPSFPSCHSITDFLKWLKWNTFNLWMALAKNYYHYFFAFSLFFYVGVCFMSSRRFRGSDKCNHLPF